MIRTACWFDDDEREYEIEYTLWGGHGAVVSVHPDNQAPSEGIEVDVCSLRAMDSDEEIPRCQWAEIGFDPNDKNLREYLIYEEGGPL